MTWLSSRSVLLAVVVGTLLLNLSSGAPSRPFASEAGREPVAMLAAARSVPVHGPFGGPPRGSKLLAGDLASTSLGWTNLSQFALGGGPPPRSYASLAYDASDGELVLFGGLTATGFPLGDTWTYAGGTWTNVTGSLAAAPAPRSAAGMAYDPSQGDVVLFGGSGFTGNFFDDTWIFHGGQWTNVSGTAGRAPPPMYAPTLAEDSSDDLVLLFGGLTQQGPFGSTWTFSGGFWANVSASAGTPPFPRLWDVASDDPADHGVLLYGGYNDNSTFFSDTWLFRAGSWSELSASSGTSPGLVAYGSLVYLASQQSVVLTGGAFVPPDLVPVDSPYSWTWHAGTWTNASGAWSGTPPPRLDPSSASVPWDNGSLVIFGGAGLNGSLSDLELLAPTLSATATLSDLSPSVGQVVGYWGHVSGGDPPLTYGWSFGDGSTSGYLQGNHTFTTQGARSVSFWARDAAGRTAFDNLTVQVQGNLSVALSATPTALDVGGRVSFQANPTGGTPPFSYLWSYGDGGSTSTGASTSHAYTTAGTFSASVEATDSLGNQATVNVTIVVSSDPAATIHAPSASDSFAPGTAVDFNATASGGRPPYTFNWSFDDGGFSSQESPVHAYRAAGSYGVVLTVEDANGGSAQAQVNVQVVSSVAAFTIEASAQPSTASVGSTLQFTSTASGGLAPYTVSWTFGDGTMGAGTTVEHTYQKAGTFEVEATGTDGAGAVATAYLNVTISSSGSSPGSGGSGSGNLGGSGLWVWPLVAAVVGAVVLVVVAVAYRRKRSRPRENRPGAGEDLPPGASEGADRQGVFPPPGSN